MLWQMVALTLTLFKLHHFSNRRPWYDANATDEENARAKKAYEVGIWVTFESGADITYGKLSVYIILPQPLPMKGPSVLAAVLGLLRSSAYSVPGLLREWSSVLLLGVG